MGSVWRKVKNAAAKTVENISTNGTQNTSAHGGGGGSRTTATDGTTTLNNYTGTATTDNHTGGGASRDYVNNVAPTTTSNATPSVSASYQALTQSYQDAMDKAMANYKVPTATTVTEETVEESPVDLGGNNGGGNGSGNGGGGSTSTNPTLDAYFSALQQQNDYRKQQAQIAYQNALARLNEAYGRSADTVNQNADNALRQAYINSMLGRKGVVADLANAGINGGATESILANLVNTYGNNRQNIEDSRANSLDQLLAAYNTNVATAGTNYANGIADIDTDYFDNYANALLNQYNNDAKLRNATASSTSKTSGTDTTTTDDAVRTNLVKNLKNYKSSVDDAVAYLDYMNVPETERAGLFFDAGLGQYPSATVGNGYKMSEDELNDIVNNLQHYDMVAGGDKLANDYMQKIATQYNLTEEEARAILLSAGL